ncbi:MAG: TetR/AcrR family transcriptional regulator [bacterium]|nr:TetR/AcrR family transcriptional regulator [bacterium]
MIDAGLRNPTTTKPGGRASRRGSSHAPPETRRAQILAAALTCFSREGFTRAKMDDLAVESRLSKGSLYRFFKSKDEVLLAIFDEFENQSLRGLDDAGRNTPVMERLRLCGESVVEIFGGQADFGNTWVDFFSHPESRERLQQMYRRVRQRLSAVVREGVESGEIRASVDPGDVAAGLLGAIEGLLLQAMVDPRFNLRRRWAGIWSLLEEGLGSASK